MKVDTNHPAVSMLEYIVTPSDHATPGKLLSQAYSIAVNIPQKNERPTSLLELCHKLRW